MIDGLMIGMLGYEERFVGSHVMDYRGDLDVAPTCCVSFVITWYNVPRLFDYSGLKPFHPAAAYWTRCSK